MQGRNSACAPHSVAFRSLQDVQEKFPVDSKSIRPFFGPAAALVFGRRMNHVSKGPLSKKEEQLSYALAASRRAEKRRFVSFVRLCDVIIASTVRKMLENSVQAALQLAGGPGALPKLMQISGPVGRGTQCAKVVM
jgi:hypothetical protein